MGRPVVTLVGDERDDQMKEKSRTASAIESSSCIQHLLIVYRFKCELVLLINLNCVECVVPLFNNLIGGVKGVFHRLNSSAVSGRVLI